MICRIIKRYICNFGKEKKELDGCKERLSWNFIKYTLLFNSKKKSIYEILNKVENIDNNNSINLSKVKYISEETHNSFLKRSILKEKDILISIAGTLGRTAIVKKEDLPANINQAISFVRLIDNNKVLENFIVFYLNSPTIKDSLLSQVKVTAIPNLTLEIISDIKLPLPSLEEQQEIVRILDEVLGNENKVKELLELEERIDMLEKSILNKAFKGELGTQNGSDIPAIEVLKEIL